MGSPFFIISVLGLFDIFKLCACITLVKVKIQKTNNKESTKEKKYPIVNCTAPLILLCQT